MRWNSHLIFGLLIGLIWISFFGVSNKYMFIGFVLFASLLPDIDHPQSKLGRKVKPISWLVNKVFGHRGVLHSIFPAIILYFVFVYAIGWKTVGMGLSVGFVSHLMSDALTKEGINFTHPVAQTRISGFIKTGGAMEWVFFLVVSIICVMKIGILF